MVELSAAAAIHHAPSGSVAKRDLLQLIASAGAAIGASSTGWPLIDSLNPSRNVRAPSSIGVGLTPVAEGQGITIIWQDKPLLVRHLTSTKVKEANDVPLGRLIEPQADSERVRRGPAPPNLALPPYAFEPNTKIRVG